MRLHFIFQMTLILYSMCIATWKFNTLVVLSFSAVLFVPLREVEIPEVYIIVRGRENQGNDCALQHTTCPQSIKNSGYCTDNNNIIIHLKFIQLHKSVHCEIEKGH